MPDRRPAARTYLHCTLRLRRRERLGVAAGVVGRPVVRARIVQEEARAEGRRGGRRAGRRRRGRRRRGRRRRGRRRAGRRVVARVVVVEAVGEHDGRLGRVAERDVGVGGRVDGRARLLGVEDVVRVDPAGQVGVRVVLEVADRIPCRPGRGQRGVRKRHAPEPGVARRLAGLDRARGIQAVGTHGAALVLRHGGAREPGKLLPRATRGIGGRAVVALPRVQPRPLRAPIVRLVGGLDGREGVRRIHVVGRREGWCRGICQRIGFGAISGC